MRPATRTFVDYLASSYRFPLALAFGAGAGVSAAVHDVVPGVRQGVRPGAILLLTLGVPMVVVGTAADDLGATLASAPSPRRGDDRDATAAASPLNPRT